MQLYVYKFSDTRKLKKLDTFPFINIFRITYFFYVAY